MKILIYLLFVQFCVYDVVLCQDTYTAAVLEFSPRPLGDHPVKNLLDNTRDYSDYIEAAANKGAQIVVCPENGLTGWHIDEKALDKISTEVPDPTERISPCQHGNYAKFFVDLSCEALRNKIYTVINLIEQRYDTHSNKKIYHNTNVVFDRNGTVIARYRKINLFDEPNIEVGHQLSTFRTDFGVTFGMFVCFDIMFKSPSLDILANQAVTDIVYSVAWRSELPFYEAISVHHGYAKSNGVNLLAAGMNKPKDRNGGSGIYLADGRIAESYISGTEAAKVIIYDVPKIKARKELSNSCQPSSSSPHIGFGPGVGGHYLEDINNFKTMVSNLEHYTFKALDLNTKVISETICGGKSQFCCSFNITVDKQSEPNYVYKLVAYYGVSLVSSAKTIGVQNCGLVACLNDGQGTCGERHREAPRGVRFERIQMTGKFDTKNSHYRPSTLDFDLMPATDYMFCRNTIKDEVEITMETTMPQDSLLTFGLIGRAFDHDDKPVGPINSANFYFANVYIVFIVSVFIFLLQE